MKNDAKALLKEFKGKNKVTSPAKSLQLALVLYGLQGKVKTDGLVSLDEDDSDPLISLVLSQLFLILANHTTGLSAAAVSGQLGEKLATHMANTLPS